MKNLEKFKELIEKKEFFKAHEVLEEVWRDEKSKNSPIQYALKGLINAAVAMELKKRGRERGVYLNVWDKFTKYEKFYTLNDEIKKTADFIKKLKP